MICVFLGYFISGIISFIICILQKTFFIVETDFLIQLLLKLPVNSTIMQIFNFDQFVRDSVKVWLFYNFFFYLNTNTYNGATKRNNSTIYRSSTTKREKCMLFCAALLCTFIILLISILTLNLIIFNVLLFIWKCLTIYLIVKPFASYFLSKKWSFSIILFVCLSDRIGIEQWMFLGCYTSIII